MQELAPLLRPWVRRRLAKRAEREAMYDNIDPFGPLLARRDPRNFQIHRRDVLRTQFRRNRSWCVAFNVGVVLLELRDGTKRRCILAGDQPPEEILELMRTFDPRIQVSGRPNPLPRPGTPSPRARRRTEVLLSIVLMVVGVAAGYLAWVGVDPNPLGLPLVVLCVLVGVWGLVKPKARREAQPQQEARNMDGDKPAGPCS